MLTIKSICDILLIIALVVVFKCSVWMYEGYSPQMVSAPEIKMCDGEVGSVCAMKLQSHM
jgi:hypothetical protein